MSDDTQPKLTTDLVVMAIQTGMLDTGLEAIRLSVIARDELLEMRTAASLNLDDRFLIKDVRPKKWEGVEVRFTGRENSWLVCEIFHDYDRSALQQRVVRLKNSHVGTITHKAGV